MKQTKIRRCKTIKNVLEKINCKFLTTNCRKLLSESKSECNKTIRLAETNMKERESCENIQIMNYAYMQHLEIVFGTQLPSYIS